MKYLLSGVSSFWGYELTKYILKEDKKYDITCVIKQNQKNEPKELDVKFIKCDITSEIEMDTISNDYDCVIFLDPLIKEKSDKKYENINKKIKGCRNLLEMAGKIQNKYQKKVSFILASSIGTIACFENNQSEANELSKYCKRSYQNIYLKSQVIMEKMSMEYSNKYFLKVSIIRTPIIYGPNYYYNNEEKIISSFLNTVFPVYSEGNISFCDVRDLCKITFEIIKKHNPNRVYNIDGTRWNIVKFYNTLENITNKTKIKIWIPYTVKYYLLLLSEKCFKKNNILEFELNNSYWNSKSLYNKDFKWTDPINTLSETLKSLK